MANTDPKMAASNDPWPKNFGQVSAEDHAALVSALERKQWNASDLIKYLEEKTANMVATAKAKNNDYTGAVEHDAFFNFEMAQKLGVPVDTRWGFIFRMTDKFSRVIGLLKGIEAKVKDETLEETLIDLANYCLLLAAWLKSKGAT